MKKFLIGCGVVALLVIVLFVGVLIFAAMKLKQTMNEYESAASEIHQVQLDFPFEAPADLRMEPERFEGYLRVRNRTIDRFRQIAFVNEIILATQEQRRADVSVGEVFGLAGQLPPAIEDVAVILREEEMSPLEFNYYSETTLVTIKRAADQGDQEMIELWENLANMAKDVEYELRKNQNTQLNIDLDHAMRMIESASVPAGNAALVLQHRDELESKPMMIIIEMVIREAFKDWQRQQQVQARRQGASTPQPIGDPIPAQ